MKLFVCNRVDTVKCHGVFRTRELCLPSNSIITLVCQVGLILKVLLFHWIIIWYQSITTFFQQFIVDCQPTVCTYKLHISFLVVLYVFFLEKSAIYLLCWLWTQQRQIWHYLRVRDEATQEGKQGLHGSVFQNVVIAKMLSSIFFFLLQNIAKFKHH